MGRAINIASETQAEQDFLLEITGSVAEAEPTSQVKHCNPAIVCVLTDSRLQIVLTAPHFPKNTI